MSRRPSRERGDQRDLNQRADSTVITQPTFLGIGMMKAGTTLVHALLDSHPHTALPQLNKEVSYFDVHADRGLDWYRSHFDLGPTVHRPDSVPTAWGDLTPGYVLSDVARANIAKLTQDGGPTLIVCLRDPAARVRSQFRHDQTRLGVRNDFERYLTHDYNHAVTRSKYATVLSPWFDQFGRDRFHFVALERYQRAPHQCATELFERLSLEPLTADQVAGVGRVNEAVTARNRLIAGTVHRGQLALRRAGLFGVTSRLAKSEHLRRLVFTNAEANTSSLEIPADLQAEFDAEMAELSTMAGIDVASMLRPMTA